MSKTIFIGGRLESKEKGNVVAGANAILDDTKGKKQNVINKETDDELLRLEQSKQNNLTFDNAPTEDSTNPVTSGGVYTAEKALSDAIEAILLLIPSAATALNKLVDTNTMNSSISTATATFRGTYNAVSDLGLTYQATHAQIEAALDALGLTADNNDYAFVQVPVSDQSQDIAKTERYKNNGTNWQYEYDLNTSGFTAAQWGAINSTITLALVQKLAALPTNAELLQALGLKQDVLTFDNAPTTDSNNPVKSDGIKNAIDNAVGEEATARDNADTALGDLIGDEQTRAEGVEGGLNTRLGAVEGSVNTIQGVIPSGATSSNKLVDNNSMTTYISTIIDNIDATFNVTSTDGHVTLAITQVNGVITSVQLTTSDIASAAVLNLKASQADLTALAGRVTTAEGNITSLTGRMTTAEGDIDQLLALYNALQQSAPQVIEPTDTWPVANPSTTVIYRVIDRVNTPPEYYSDYMWNGTSMVLMATYNNAVDTTPKKESANLITSGGVFANIGAFDISEYHKSGGTLATYADLTAALAALPSDYQKGGMSIKFVQSSDNKYVQFRLMAQSFTTNEADWQGVDEEPTNGSDNLVKSSGVVNYVGQIASESTTSSNYNLLTNLSIKSGEEFYAKVIRTNEGSERIIICYNGSNSNRLIDSDTDDSFIGNFVKLTAPEDITQLGVYIGASGNSFVLEVSSKIDAKIQTNKVAIDELNTETSILHSEVFSKVSLNNESLWEIGEYDSSTGKKGTNPNRIRTKEYIKISPNATVEITPLSSGVTTRLIVFAYDKNYSFLGYKAKTSGNIGISDVLTNFPNAVYYNINAYDNNGSALSSVSEAFTLFSLNTIDVCDEKTDYLNSVYENGSINLSDAWKIGEIDATTGKDKATGTRLCSLFYQRFEDDARVEIIPNQSFDEVQVIKYIYDRNQNYLGYFSSTQPYSQIRTTYPNAYWLRLSIRRFRNSGTEVAQDIEFLKNIVWHGFTEMYLLGRVENNNILYGKKWVACGDSFTHGDFSNSVTPATSYTIQDGRYAGELKVYPYIIGNRNNMVIVNEAVNGSTMTYASDVSNAFSEDRYKNIPEDADYITLKFGINDDVYHKDMPLGTIEDETNTTFYGAYNKVLKYIITHHLDAKIGVIVTNGSTVEIANATIEVAKKWGVPYINEATDENCPFVFRSNREHLDSYIANERRKHWVVSNVSGSSNAHPNEFAHEFESTVIENWLRSL